MYKNNKLTLSQLNYIYKKKQDMIIKKSLGVSLITFVFKGT